jgi:hypothetical protein
MLAPTAPSSQLAVCLSHRLRSIITPMSTPLQPSRLYFRDPHTQTLPCASMFHPPQKVNIHPHIRRRVRHLRRCDIVQVGRRSRGETRD